MVSVILPAWHEEYLNKTIESIVTNFEGEFEIIAVLDGYWQQVVGDPRVRAVHLGKNRGMRGAINAGVAVARGEYIKAIQSYNTAILRFPGNVLAGMFGFTGKDYYQAEEGALGTPEL